MAVEISITARSKNNFQVFVQFVANPKGQPGLVGIMEFLLPFLVQLAVGKRTILAILTDTFCE